MLTTIKGTYKEGRIILNEEPPVKTATDVIVTFLEKDNKKNYQGKRKLGGLEGKVSIPDDFNEPLDELKDYM